jgi:starch phosphorylase
MDGWWAEGYNGENGWAITPHAPNFEATYRNQEEANDLLDLLEKQVIPMYYDRNSQGYSEDWVRMSKASMKSCIPRFNAQRMVRDYINKYYAPASRQSRLYCADNYKGAGELAIWKARVNQSWPMVSLRRIDDAPGSIMSGDSLNIRVACVLGELTAEDVVLECVIGTESENGVFTERKRIPFASAGSNDRGEAIFELNLIPPLSGLQFYKLRIYPFHRLLCHRFETGHMIWL